MKEEKVSTHRQREKTAMECLFILCNKEVLKLLVEELTDKIDAANQRNDATGWASILLYGETLANKQGFILLRWERAGASEIFRNIINRFLDDHDIVDHLCLPMTIFDLDSEHVE